MPNLLRSLPWKSKTIERERLTDFIAHGYQVIFGRQPDDNGLSSHLSELASRRMSPIDFVQTLLDSPEYRNRQKLGPLESLHESRKQMVRQLPKARTIVDLGGAADNYPPGALILMGYPYPFERLTIIEPPRAERHEIYRNVVADDANRVMTPQGEVRYHFSSMANLSAFPDQSVNLVFSGESIEHVTRTDVESVLREVRRILKPDGSFCFDTPNRAVTKIQSPDALINVDHKHEYTHEEMVDLLSSHRFTISEARGICWMPKATNAGDFDYAEMVANTGLFDDIRNCYLLYYRCRPL
jgi:SAM-dependent methyltransferase